MTKLEKNFFYCMLVIFFMVMMILTGCISDRQIKPQYSDISYYIKIHPLDDSNKYVVNIACIHRQGNNLGIGNGQELLESCITNSLFSEIKDNSSFSELVGGANMQLTYYSNFSVGNNWSTFAITNAESCEISVSHLIGSEVVETNVKGGNALVLNAMCTNISSNQLQFKGILVDVKKGIVNSLPIYILCKPNKWVMFSHVQILHSVELENTFSWSKSETNTNYQP